MGSSASRIQAAEDRASKLQKDLEDSREQARLQSENLEKDLKDSRERARLESEKLDNELKKSREQARLHSERLDKELKQSREQAKNLQAEMEKLGEAMEEMAKQGRKKKEEFEGIIGTALTTIEAATKKVYLILGAQGAGKSTLSKFMFGVEAAVTGKGNSNVTTELELHYSSVLSHDIVDTVGKTPDIRGLMRVIACAYNRGWDPVAIIVVHGGRCGHFSAIANLLGASEINVVRFEPMTFWRLMQKTQMGAEACLDMTLSSDDEAQIPHINILTPNYREIKGCEISEELLGALKDMSFESHHDSSDAQGIANSLAYFMAKTIAQRARYTGSDVKFIDRQE